jgi:integrase
MSDLSKLKELGIKKRGHNLVSTFCGWNRLDQFIEKCPTSTRLLALTLWNTGGRICEALNMRKSMISYPNKNNILVSGMAVEKKWIYLKVKNDKGETVDKIPQKIPTVRNFPINRSEQFVEPWLQELKYVRDDQLFSFGRVNAWRKIVNVDSEWWPHRFRTERASQLVKEYGFEIPQLFQWFGWSSVREAAGYVRLDVVDLMEKWDNG